MSRPVLKLKRDNASNGGDSVVVSKANITVGEKDKEKITTSEVEKVEVKPRADKINKDNKGTKNSRKKHKLSPKRLKEILQYLRDTYPKCFTKPVLPLAINIKNQLFEKIEEQNIEPTLTKMEIRIMLFIYTKRKDYRDLVVLDADRFNLDGSVHSKVTQEQINKAKNAKKKDQASK